MKSKSAPIKKAVIQSQYSPKPAVRTPLATSGKSISPSPDSPSPLAATAVLKTSTPAKTAKTSPAQKKSGIVKFK